MASAIVISVDATIAKVLSELDGFFHKIKAALKAFLGGHCFALLQTDFGNSSVKQSSA